MVCKSLAEINPLKLKTPVEGSNDSVTPLGSGWVLLKTSPATKPELIKTWAAVILEVVFTSIKSSTTTAVEPNTTELVPVVALT